MEDFRINMILKFKVHRLNKIFTRYYSVNKQLNMESLLPKATVICKIIKIVVIILNFQLQY